MQLMETQENCFQKDSCDRKSKASTQYYLQVIKSQIKTEIPSEFWFRGMCKRRSSSRAVLPEPCLLRTVLLQLRGSWSAVSHTCPSKDSKYTALALPDERLLRSDASRSQSRFSRKYQFSFFQLSLQTLWNPSNSTSA